MAGQTYTRRTVLGLTAGALATGVGSAAAGSTPEDIGSIAYGETKEGEIDDNDMKDPIYDDLAEPVVFEGAAGDEVRVTQRSSAFDTYLILGDGDGNSLAENDDGDDVSGTNSQLTATLPESGAYTIWAGSLSGDATGAYSLTLERVSTGDSGSDGADLRSIAYGETKEGEIDDSDPRDPSYSDLAEPVAFEGAVGDEVRVTQQSSAFDTFVLVEAPDGEVVAQNDDGDDVSGTNSQLTLTLAEAGTYTIWAGSLSGDATESYTLSLERLSTGNEDAVDLRSIAYGQTKEGELDSSDPSDPSYGDLAEPVGFEGTAGDEVRVTQQSSVFDTFVLVEGPDGEVVAENDDGDDVSGTNSQLTVRLAESGVYTIWAGSLSGNANGAYSLTLEGLTTATTTTSQATTSETTTAGTESGTDGTSSGGTSGGGSDDGGSGTAGDVPGFGVLSAAGAVGVGSLLRHLRTRDD